MKFNKTLVALLILALSIGCWTNAVMAGTPHTAYGKIFNQNGSVPANGQIAFNAYIVSRPSEILTLSSTGSTYDGGWWAVSVGNFPTPWSAGDVLRLDATNTANGQTGSVQVTMTTAGSDAAADLYLEGVEYTLTMAVNPVGGGTTTPAVGPHTYSDGTVVNISATPAGGYHFVNWTGDVANPNNASTTVTVNANKTVTANFALDAPTAGFSGNPTSGVKPLNVNFTDESTGSVTSWSWNFGDGGTSTQQSPSHSYANAGSYTVTLTVTGPGGSDAEVKTDYITVNEPAPVAAFSGNPTSGLKPLNVNFADESSGIITNWSWNFGDGGTSTQQNPSHSYTNAGSYTVTLTVTGPGGSDGETKTNYITVSEPAPVAAFSGTPTSGVKPLNVSFTDASTGPITSWSWNFGDGGTSTQQSPTHNYTVAGTYTVSLTVTGPGGSDAEVKTDYITVNEPAPVAAFTGNPTSGVKPLNVSYTDQSTGTVTSWSWNFGDGATSTQQNPSHSYANAGSYTVTLTVTGPGGSDVETKTNYITVSEPAPVAAFSGTPTSGLKPLNVNFTDASTGETTSWSWNFGDGGTSTQQSPSHTYANAGSYTVTLTVTGPGGSDVETKTNYITVSTPAPIAAFSGTPTTGLKPLNVSFTDASTGEITSWSWNFGDGGTSTQQSPSHVYANAGSYTVSLTVTGPGGSDGETKTNYITVSEPAPVAAFTGNPTNGDKPLNVNFTDQSTGTITTWSWNFGDGGTSTAQSPSHTYTAVGSYTVTLTVTGPGGSDGETKTNYITVNEPAPVAAFTGSPLNGNKPLNVNFTDQSTGVVTSWSWTFGDGGTSTAQNPSHVYATQGNYTVALTVTGPGGSDVETKTDYITVTVNAPVAAFSGTPTSGLKPLNVNFADASTGEITSWSWNFGDGQTSTQQSPSHVYANAGSYTVSLTVTGPGGSDVETKTNYITVNEPAPVAAFSGTPTNGLKPLNVSFTDASTGAITSWSWTFGDGGTSTQQSPAHNYTVAGTYTVSLTVTGPGGSDSETKTDYITVNEPAPVAAFVGNPLTGNKPLTVNFTDQSTGVVTSWSWTFGDGGTSTTQNPSHVYTTQGTYTVALTVTGPGGSDVETKTNYITVTVNAPVAQFSGTPLSGPKPLAVQFTDASTGEITSWSWTFGDGGTSTAQSPSHTYNAAGQYTVALTVTGPGGSDVETKTNYITATEPDIAVNPASYDFDDVRITFPEQTTIVVRNEGGATLAISAFNITGVNADQFSILSGGNPVNIAPAGTHNVVVRFEPSSTGAKTGALTIASNDPDENPLNVALTGNGTPAPAPDISVSPTSLNFGTVLFGNNVVKTFTIQNSGDTTLNVSPITLAGANADQFQVLTAGPFEIAVNGSQVVSVKFAPSNAGAQTASAQVNCDDPDESVVSVSLSGVGEEPQPNIVVTPASVDFGNVVLGRSKTKDVTVSNTGTDTLLIVETGIEQYGVTGSGLGIEAEIEEFDIVSGSAPFMVLPGASHVIKVKFEPLAEGERNGRLDVISNDPDQAVVNVDLTGNGIFEPPVGRFFATPTSGYPVLSVKFDDASEGNPTAWLWEFGDGETSTAQNPTHVYRRPGLYDVRLTITTSAGNIVVDKENFIDVWGYEQKKYSPLVLVDNNYASPKEGWENAIDEDISGWAGTTTAKDNPPMAIFAFKDGKTKIIDKVMLLTDTGVEYPERWVRKFLVYVSTTGIADGNFTKVLDGTKNSGGWETFQISAVNAKYIKLVLAEPGSGWRQLGEFRVCPVQPAVNANSALIDASSPHVGNGVDDSYVDMALSDATGAPLTGLTKEDIFFNIQAGNPIISGIYEKIPGIYIAHIANLGGITMPVEVIVQGVIVGDFAITFTQPNLTKASLVLLKSGATANGEGWDNAIDGDVKGWDGTVSATDAAPYAIFGFSDGGIKAVQKLNLLVDTNVGYSNRWVKRFRVLVSTSGMNDADFSTAYDGIQTQAKWQSHQFPAANARYVKILVDYPTTGVKQLGELEVEVSPALITTDLVSGVETIAGAPEQFMLKDNYPNPFNPETRIEFALPHDQQITIQVFNQIGQLVRTLYDGHLGVGFHAIVWNGRNDADVQMPSGTYFLSVQTEEQRFTHKMLMVK